MWQKARVLAVKLDPEEQHLVGREHWVQGEGPRGAPTETATKDYGAPDRDGSAKRMYRTNLTWPDGSDVMVLPEVLELLARDEHDFAEHVPRVPYDVWAKPDVAQ